MNKPRWRRIINLVRPEVERNMYLYHHYEWAQQCAPIDSFGFDQAPAKSFVALMNMDMYYGILLKLPFEIRKRFAKQSWALELCEELGELKFDYKEDD